MHSCDCASSEFQYLDRSQVTDMGGWVSFDQWEAVICENWPITGQDINKSLTLWHTSREMFQNWRNVAQLTTKCISSSYWLHNWIESLQVKTHFFLRYVSFISIYNFKIVLGKSYSWRQKFQEYFILLRECVIIFEMTSL